MKIRSSKFIPNFTGRLVSENKVFWGFVFFLDYCYGLINPHGTNAQHIKLKFMSQTDFLVNEETGVHLVSNYSFFFLNIVPCTIQ